MFLTLPVNEGDHFQGNENAPVVLVEYGDYQCPYCQKAHPIVKGLQKRFAPKLKFVFRNFPLTNIHPYARLAALGSEAAAKQGKFWEMHDYLFEHHKDLDEENIVLFAWNLDLDIIQFKKDMAALEADPHSKIEIDQYSGLRSGVSGTPTFFVNNEKFTGNWQNDELRHLIEEEIKAGRF